MLFLLSVLVLTAVGNTIQVQRHGELGVLSSSGLDTDSRGSRQDGDLSLTQEVISDRIRILQNQGFKVAVHIPKPFIAATPKRAQPSIVPLITRPGTSLSQRYLQLLETGEADVGNGVIRNYRDQVYMIPLKFGDQELLSVLDTGSSDTWLVGTDFKCSARPNNPTGDGCQFGPRYKKTNTFSEIPNEKFSISYSEEFVEGMMGTETVTLGNITVKNQQVAIINSGQWRGDGISSGLTGLAFPSGSSLWSELKGAKNAYSPIFTSMYRQGLVAPYFSIALNRANEGPGALSLGGLPGAPIRFSSNFARAPMQYMLFGEPDTLPKSDDSRSDYRLYRITIDGFSFGSKSSPVDNKKVQVTVDSGTAPFILPSEVARAFNNGWSPAAHYNRTTGYLVECTATAPKFGIKLNGTTFWVDGQDLVIPPEHGGPGALCTSGVQESRWVGGSIIGAAFLKNVVAVFDVGAAEMRFASRER